MYIVYVPKSPVVSACGASAMEAVCLLVAMSSFACHLLHSLIL